MNPWTIQSWAQRVRRLSDFLLSVFIDNCSAVLSLAIVRGGELKAPSYSAIVSLSPFIFTFLCIFSSWKLKLEVLGILLVLGSLSFLLSVLPFWLLMLLKHLLSETDSHLPITIFYTSSVILPPRSEGRMRRQCSK